MLFCWNSIWLCTLFLLIKKNAIIFKSMSPWTFWNPWHFVGSGGMPLLVSLRSTSPANVSILPLPGLGGSLEEAHQLLLRQGFESTRQGREDKGQYVLEGRQYLDKQAFPVFCCPSPIMWKDLVFWFVSVKKKILKQDTSLLWTDTKDHIL